MSTGNVFVPLLWVALLYSVPQPAVGAVQQTNVRATIPWHNTNYRFRLRIPANWQRRPHKNFALFLTPDANNPYASQIFVAASLGEPKPDHFGVTKAIRQLRESVKKIPDGKLTDHKIIHEKGVLHIRARLRYTLYEGKKPHPMTKIMHALFLKGNQYVLMGVFPDSSLKTHAPYLQTMLDTFECTQQQPTPHRKGLIDRIMDFAQRLSVPLFLLCFVVAIFIYAGKRRKRQKAIDDE